MRETRKSPKHSFQRGGERVTRALPSLLSPGGESSPAIPERKDESEGDKGEFSPPFLETRGESEGDQGGRVVRVLNAILKRKG